MEEQILLLKQEAINAFSAATKMEELESLKAKYLGRKGQLNSLLKRLPTMPQEVRPTLGKLLNQVKSDLENVFEEQTARLRRAELQAKLESEKIDITMPGLPFDAGNRHVLTAITQEIIDIFSGMGFEIAEGPEVETDQNNFVALNIPKDHPARDMQQTFYITSEILLRTHTSPVQIRGMRARYPRLPVRLIAPGTVYRRDQADARHSPIFHQVEGLAIGEGVRFSDLKGTLLVFARRMFGPDTVIRMRPSYFPFTEPSAEVDVSCTVCKGKGCRTCGGSGWLEILGSGMVHPSVIRNGGYDPERVTGFAFGMGVERIAMLKYGIDDLRLFLLNDIRFLSQFH
ncbi:MAG TPA: phenylalanine--tRNA ligase subunit alpha [Firmicutes bacterium]|nr:phenylalanine--tRNA ligase subunit alpha [Bacillota bacterium]